MSYQPGGIGGYATGGEASGPNRVLVGIVVALVIVLLVLVGVLVATRKSGGSSGAATTTTTSTSTTSTSTSTTSTSTSTTSTTATTSTTTSTTSTTLDLGGSGGGDGGGGGGNRAPTSAERAAITEAANAQYPDYRVRLIRIADSDDSWAALEYDSAPGQNLQPFDEIRHLDPGTDTWDSVANGTAKVSCGSDVPVSVQDDFADLFGPCD